MVAQGASRILPRLKESIEAMERWADHSGSVPRNSKKPEEQNQEGKKKNELHLVRGA